MRVCGISRESADYRKARMDILYQREQDFLKARGYSCFLQHPLEKQVYSQFQEFIEKHR